MNEQRKESFSEEGNRALTRRVTQQFMRGEISEEELTEKLKQLQDVLKNE